MHTNNEILITGIDGLVGTELKALYPNCIGISHKDFDLTSQNDIKYMFYKYRPSCVIHLAARVGGILDNSKYQATYFDDNILMNTLLVKHAYENGVNRFIGILSSCIYPDVFENYPLELSNIHSGPPAITNFSYGYAKRCLSVQIDSYNKQYGTKYNYVMPCNLYGNNDKLDPQKSHFIAALLMKIKKAVENNETSITLMGDGSPLRQFMNARDLAKILKYTVDNNIYENFNIAPNENLSIKEMAEIALSATDNSHLKINFDISKPNGQHRKDISNKRLLELIPNYKFISLKDGITEMYNFIK